MSRIYRHKGRARRKRGKLTTGDADGPCCCGKDECVSCNDCSSDYSPLHNEPNDPGCFPRSVKVTLADIFPNEGPIPEASGYKSTQKGNDFFFTGLTGAVNGEYTLHQTTGGYYTELSPSQLLPTFDDRYGYPPKISSRLIMALDYSGGLYLQLVGSVLLYDTASPTDTTVPVDEVLFDFVLFVTKFKLDEPFVRCLDLDETDNGTGEGVETFDPDEDIPPGGEPTPIPYVTRWGDGGYDKEAYLDEQGTATVSICGDDDDAPQDPFNPYELSSNYAVSAKSGSISVLGPDGETVLQTCSFGGVAILNYEDSSPGFLDPRTYDQLDDPAIPFTGQTVGTTAFCTYLKQLTLNLIDGEWQLRIGPPPGVILYKSNSYGPIGKWGGAFDTYEDPESGKLILVDVTGVYVG